MDHLIGRLNIMTYSIIGDSIPPPDIEQFQRLSLSEGEEQRRLTVQLDPPQQGSVLSTVGNEGDKGSLPIETLRHLSDCNYRSGRGDCRCTPKSN